MQQPNTVNKKDLKLFIVIQKEKYLKIVLHIYLEEILSSQKYQSVFTFLILNKPF